MLPVHLAATRRSRRLSPVRPELASRPGCYGPPAAEQLRAVVGAGFGPAASMRVGSRTTADRTSLKVSAGYTRSTGSWVGRCLPVPATSLRARLARRLDHASGDRRLAAVPWRESQDSLKRPAWAPPRNAPLVGCKDKGGTGRVLGVTNGHDAGQVTSDLNAVPAVAGAIGRLAPDRARQVHIRATSGISSMDAFLGRASALSVS
jgi:hypothetical protein